MLYWQIYDGLLLKEHLPRTQEKLGLECLEHNCERSIKLCDWSAIQLSLLLLTREAGVVNVYLSWLSTLSRYTATKPGVISNPFKSLRKIPAGQIFLKTLFFSTTYFCKFLRPYLFLDCLQANRMYVTSFWRYSKLVLEKATKSASYELAIHTVFSYWALFYQGFCSKKGS